jgi:phospholipid/cholesterol/gamma-HCH transport system ATP-binding protein
LIIKLKREIRVTSVVVTHDMHSAFRVGDRIVMLDKGKTIFDGAPQQIQQSKNPLIRSFVLGEAGPKEMESLDRNFG